MYCKKLSILFVILFSISVFAQVISDTTSQTVKKDFRSELGLRDEITPYPFNLHIVFGLRLFQNFKVSYKIGGLQIKEDYKGIDHGLILEGRISSFMASVGITFLKMRQESHGTISSSGNINQRGISIGAGYYFSDHFLVDVYFYSPVGNSVYAKNLSFGTESYIHGFWGFALQGNVF